ncbi:hypothetical protein BO94DRAFT_226146 [Aspergillus sclerotioniger CBS 115572]|uniref:Transmembrane protein n=1 Tax=Aspergillus sclerotioniger CBS 115572 TaxID=1450535 RepID=A0A317XCF0_9EURO|nr:hypothetical protein BO94DRAFT_226146 [Aspergillus sclerotioniger CBS 115572]PWY95372.1 hypothetical protein BO94DRAFT_226146 [Aspergillus sclerotioniger CBS 115572]
MTYLPTVLLFSPLRLGSVRDGREEGGVDKVVSGSFSWGWFGFFFWSLWISLVRGIYLWLVCYGGGDRIGKGMC